MLVLDSFCLDPIEAPPTHSLSIRASHTGILTSGLLATANAVGHAGRLEQSCSNSNMHMDYLEIFSKH